METQECYSFEYNEVKFNKYPLFSAGTLVVPRNSISLIVGKNGTGKSTLLKQIRYRYKDCIYVAQHGEQILKELSIFENLTMCQPNISVEYVISVLEQLKLSQLLKHDSHELSGGEKRIISILRALFSDSSIILMDEPTNDLDYRTVDQIINILNTFKKEKTILIVTHDERLYDLAETKFLIDNHSIKPVTSMEKQSIQAELPSGCETNLKDNGIIKTFFHQDAGRMFCIVLLCFIFIVNIVKFSSILSKEISPIGDYQVNFCNSLYDNSLNLLYDGYLPTSFLDIVNTDASVWNLKGELDEVLEKTALLPYNLNLKLPENEFVRYYNLMFYSPKSNELINVLDYCVNDSGCTSVVSDFFLLSSVLTEYNTLPFNDQIYAQAISEIEKNYPKEELELVFCVAILDSSHINFFDYVSDAFFKENLDANYYIASNETIALVQSAIQISEMEFYGKLGLIFAGITGLLMIFNTFLVNMIRKKQSEILRDYGFEFEDVKPIIKKVYGIRLSLMVSIIIIVANILIAFFVEKLNIAFIYLPSIVMTAILLIVCRIEYIISNLYNKKIFMFGGIFDDF